MAVNCAQGTAAFWGTAAAIFCRADGERRIARRRRGAEGVPYFVRAAGADAGQEADHPFEGGFVARVGDELEPGGDILDVGQFAKTEAAGDAERDVAAGQFELQFQGVEMGAIKDGHLVQRGCPPRAIAAPAGR